MKRRRFVTVLGGSALTVAVAGCLGDDDDEEEDDGDDGVDEPDDDPAQEHFDEAIEELIWIENRIQELQDIAEEDGREREQADIDELWDRFDDAEAALDDAGAEAGDVLAEQIEHARDVLAFHEIRIEASQLGLDTQQTLERADELDDEERDEEAVEYFDDALDLLDEQRTILEDIIDAFEAIEPGALDEPELDYSDDVWAYISLDSADEIDHAETFVLGRRQMTAAWPQLGSGDFEYNNGNYEAAIDEWETGLDYATDARSHFQELADNPAVEDELQQGGEVLVQWVEDLQITVFELLIEGAEAAQAGDVEEGDQLVQDAWDILLEA